MEDGSFLLRLFSCPPPPHQNSKKFLKLIWGDEKLNFTMDKRITAFGYKEMFWPRSLFPLVQKFYCFESGEGGRGGGYPTFIPNGGALLNYVST